MKQFTIKQNDAGQRLDKFLTKAFPSLPSSLLYKYIRIKRVKVNGSRAKPEQKLAPGDVLSLYINDELLEGRKASPAAGSSEIKPIYEDGNVLIVHKPRGLPVHENEPGDDNLIDRAKRYLGAQDPDDMSFSPALCHRIDRNTEGLVIIAKTAAALRIINENIRQRKLEKYYLCLVHGVPSPREGRLKNFLLKDESTRTVTVCDRPVPGALTAETGYRVIESRGGYSLVECRLYTGRTHQIRAQLSHFGYPLLGDTKYGLNKQNKGLPFKHQALCASAVRFSPEGEWEELSYLSGRTFVSDAPDFMKWFEELDDRPF